MTDAYTLAHVRADKLEIECSRCNRHGLISVASLIAKHGADAVLPDVKNHIARDGGCKNVGNNSDICRAKFSRESVLSWTREEDLAVVARALK
jgi:ribonuclease HII